MRVSPVLALRLLAATNNRPGQRDMDWERVEEFAETITAARWESGPCIGFSIDEEGRLHLMNGQHRLAAVVRAGQAVEIDIEIE